jgi:hypothetical protein
MIPIQIRIKEVYLRQLQQAGEELAGLLVDLAPEMTRPKARLIVVQVAGKGRKKSTRASTISSKS